MESLQSRLASASLADNLADITRQIQASPANADLRAAFVQLLCLAGNWTRAQTQLQSWLALTPRRSRPSPYCSRPLPVSSSVKRYCAARRSRSCQAARGRGVKACWLR